MSGDITIPTRWITLGAVHQMNETCRKACTVHNPSHHHMRYWPLNWRADRHIFERMCDHGIGHPDPDQFPYWDATDQGFEKVHGCDGCCKQPRG